MTSNNESSPRVPLRFLLTEIEEQTHDLSNLVGNSMNLLLCQIREEENDLPERVVQAAELSARATGKLRNLMWNLGKLHALMNEK